LSKKPTANAFSSVLRNNCASTVLMLKEVMTAFYADNFESKFTQSADKPIAGY
jgi:hypothetical protein